MEKLKFNPNNKKYYSEEFIKGFECGVERQFNADMAEKTAEWVGVDDYPHEDWECDNCGYAILGVEEPYRYCPGCGKKMWK